MRTNTFIISILLFVLSSGINAQPYIDALSVKYYSLPEQTDMEKPNDQVRVTWFNASMEVPIKIKNDYLVLSPLFEKYTFDLSSAPATNLYGIALPVTYLKQWKNPSWQTAFVAIPRISSDLKAVSGDDYQMGGVVMAIYNKRDDLKYKFGAYYNSEYFGPFIMPLLGIDWKINERLSLFGVLPVSMNLEYKAGKHIYTGISLYTVTNSYRLYNGDWYKIEDNHLKLFVDFYMTKNFVFNIEVGHSILRRYTYGVDTNNGKIETNLDYKDGLLLKAGIAWRIRLDEKQDGK